MMEGFQFQMSEDVRGQISQESCESILFPLFHHDLMVFSLQVFCLTFYKPIGALPEPQNPGWNWITCIYDRHPIVTGVQLCPVWSQVKDVHWCHSCNIHMNSTEVSWFHLFFSLDILWLCDLKAWNSASSACSCRGRVSQWILPFILG